MKKKIFNKKKKNVGIFNKVLNELKNNQKNKIKKDIKLKQEFLKKEFERLKVLDKEQKKTNKIQSKYYQEIENKEKEYKQKLSQLIEKEKILLFVMLNW